MPTSEQLAWVVCGILGLGTFIIIVLTLKSLENRANRNGFSIWLRRLFRVHLTALDGLTISPENKSPIPESLPTEPEISMEFSIAEVGFKCPICAVEVVGGAEVVRCSKCQTPAHKDCCEFNGKCGVYGCGGAYSAPQADCNHDWDPWVAYGNGQDYDTRSKCPKCGKHLY